MKYLKVLIDNGHGNNTAGKRSIVWPNGKQLLEWEFNRSVAKKLYDKCLAHTELQPILLVPESNDIGLLERCARANKLGNNSDSIFISIHGNAANTALANGWEGHTSPGQTKADTLMDCIYNAVKRILPSCKIRQDFSDGDPDFESKFAVLLKTNMPAVLTENGFFTNYEECMNMLDDAWQDKIAEAHLQGILQYYSKIIK